MLTLALRLQTTRTSFGICASVRGSTNVISQRDATSSTLRCNGR
jgi:hypothetical protein